MLKEPDLIDRRMHDGSRLFLELPKSVYPENLVEHLKRLAGVEIGAVIDTIPESWIDFRMENQSFSVNDQFGEFWFFVEDSACPNDVLQTLRHHLVPFMADRS